MTEANYWDRSAQNRVGLSGKADKQGEDGYIVAEVPIIPGCLSQGITVEEALANIREATELSLENREAEGWELPRDYRAEQIEVVA